jgi:glycosyltransferase involved in cell wall biosynthesis
LDKLSGLPSLAGSDNSIVRVGLLATFARWKGHEVFLRALSLLPDLALRGYVIGGPVYQTNGSQYSIEELKSLAQKLGVSDRVGFTGFVTQPAAAIRSLDIVVHASTAPEPFGLAIVEAMACGRPVIASEAGGAAELIQTNGRTSEMNSEPEINAASHAPGDARGLAERITQLARDPHLRSRIGAAGRDTAQRRFDIPRLAQELVPIYQGVTTTS